MSVAAASQVQELTSEAATESVTGNALVAEALVQQGVKDFFFLMGGPRRGVQIESIARGLRGINVRHEQAAAMMAHAYSRVSGKCGVCMAASGPGTLNLSSALANALIDCVRSGGVGHRTRGRRCESPRTAGGDSIPLTTSLRARIMLRSRWVATTAMSRRLAAHFAGRRAKRWRSRSASNLPEVPRIAGNRKLVEGLI